MSLPRCLVRLSHGPAVALAFFFAICTSVTPLEAQVAGQLPDSIARLLAGGLGPDTLQLDTISARGRAWHQLRERLASLARAPGSLPDSVRVAMIEEEARVLAARSEAGNDASFSDEVTDALALLSDYQTVSYQAEAADFRVDEELLILFGSLGLDPPGSDSLPPDSTPPDLVVPDTAEVGIQTPDTLSTEVPTSDSAAVVLPEGSSPDGPDAAEGRRASLSGEGFRLEGERYIRLDLRADRIEARGDPTFTPQGPGDPVSADSLNIDLNGERASAFGASTAYSEGGARWHVDGNIPELRDRVTFGAHTMFTSCELDEPHYHFQTDELKIVRGETMVARPVRFYIADVPIAWLPFFAQSLSSGRASGLLTPTFSANDIVRANQGYRRRISNVGYYWAMSEYSDATVAIDWFDDRFFALSGQLRYAWERQFLEGGVSFRRFWRSNGRQELALDTRHSWEISETTNLDVSASFASSADFVRENSFDPAEVSRDIRSEGGLSKQFTWGSLNVSANRQQSLANDRVRMTFPSVSLSLRPLEFFSAPRATARWYNNLAWNGSARFSRSIDDQPVNDTLGFSFSLADTERLDASVSSSFSLGDFGFSQNLSVDQSSTLDVPLDSLPGLQNQLLSQGLGALDPRFARAMLEGENEQVTDIAQTDLSWALGLNWTKNLRGSTTFTPRLSIAGRSRKSDTVSVAQSFVSGPTRVSFGARLKADIYGMYPGIGGLEAIRHKISPQFTYDYSPAVTPTDLQRQVFGSREIQPRSVISVGFNQTWEGKRPVEVPDPSELAPSDSLAPMPTSFLEGNRPQTDSTFTEALTQTTDSLEVAGGETAPPRITAPPRTFGQGGDLPSRQQTSQIVNLLSLSTSLVEYDFIEADSAGDFLQGFTTTRLTNSISSDFLRGLTISTSHDLFDDQVIDDGTEEGSIRREFAPHLATLNLSFQLSGSSPIFRLLGLGGGSEGDAPPPPPDDFYAPGGVESAIVPTTTPLTAQPQQTARSSSRAWSTSVSFALNRSREGGPGDSQTLRFNTRLSPTDQWSMNWSTSYDVLEKQFNDHKVRLTRDLHRWQAHFDFLQTATGNWSFRFEVSLLDNTDLKFDYRQQSLPTFTN